MGKRTVEKEVVDFLTVSPVSDALESRSRPRLRRLSAESRGKGGPMGVSRAAIEEVF